VVKNQSADRTKHPLYRELLDIGSKEKSIAPTRLKKYKALLESPEIRRRAGMTTDTNQLAKHASQALRIIVDETPDETSKLVLQAALSTTKAYRGLRVVQREEILDKLPKKISKDMFRYHRRKGFETIIDILESGADNFTVAPAPKPLQDEHEGFVLPLIRIAAFLQYAILASLFTTNFEPLAKTYEGSLISGRLNQESGNACTRQAFGIFAEFLGIFMDYFDESERHRLTHYFPEQAIDRLSQLLQGIIDCGPPFDSADDRLEFSWNVAVTSETDPFFQEIWEPWFYGTSSGLSSSWLLLPSIPTLEPIAAKAAAIVIIITYHITVQQPVIREARTMACNIISYSYPCDEFAPIFNGRSLRDYVDTYLDTESLRLANSDIV
jgi:hypothetical protein